MKKQEVKKVTDFIAFEGLDFSGKTTLAKVACSLFEKNNKTCTYFRNPWDVPIGNEVVELRKKCKLYFSQAFLHCAANLEIRPIARQNPVDFFVLDRFYLSTIAYNCRNDKERKAIRIISRKFLKTPSLFIFVDISLETFKKRIEGKELDFIEKDLEKTFEKKRNIFLSEMKLVSNKLIIDGNLPLEKVIIQLETFLKTHLLNMKD